MHKYPSFVRFGLITLALATLLYTYALTWSTQPAAASQPAYQTYSPLSGPRFAAGTKLRLRVTDVDLLGMTSFPTGYTYGETVVGGLSGLVYNRSNGFYTALSDDRSQNNDARFYSLTIDLNDGTLDEGDVEFTGLVTMENEAEEPFPANSIDPEGIALTNDFRIFISSEGNMAADPPLQPFIREFSFVGAQIAELPLPEKYLPQADGSSGLRDNLGFEGLTISPDQRYLYASIEGALAQDGSIATLENGSLVRILQYDLASRTPVHEYVYMVDAIPQAPDPENGFADNGLVDLQPLDNNGTFLTLERSYAEGVGNTIRLYQAHTQGALDVSAVDSLLTEEGVPYEVDPMVQKRLLVDFAELGIQPDNVEGMVFGPLLPDGRQALILVSDNNFNETQSTQFIALGLSFEAIGVVDAKAETAQVLNADPAEEAPAEGVIPGDADDPAIWVHPTEPERSLIFATLKDGGLAIFGLDGNTLGTIPPETYGGTRFNNVDIVYDFTLGDATIDLIVATDRANDTLAIFSFEPASRAIENVTSAEMPASIFGVDDGEQTAYGLATYTDPADGTVYAFVSQRDGDQVAQLALTADGNGGVTAEIVRTITLPTVGEDETASQSEGMVVDRELGYLYVAMEDGLGILKYKASPTTGDDPEPVRIIQSDVLLPDVEGLTIYYGGANGAGYLLASSQGDSTFAVFERAGDNRYVGSFAIGAVVTENGTIDQVNESDGADVVNVALGSQYPSGLLVVQDGANDPQSAVADEGELENRSTNFKLVPWENVANGFALPLLIDAESYRPRE